MLGIITIFYDVGQSPLDTFYYEIKSKTDSLRLHVNFFRFFYLIC